MKLFRNYFKKPVAITTSARVGYYPVFLFSSKGSRLYLSLNQARFEVKEEFVTQYKEVLSSRAEVARGLLRNFVIESLYEGFLNLESEDDLPVGYSVGNILSIEYKSGSLPTDEVIVSDIHKILSLYRSYIALRSGNIDSDNEEIPEEISTGEEKKKYRWHRRAERNQKLSKDAKNSMDMYARFANSILKNNMANLVLSTLRHTT